MAAKGYPGSYAKGIGVIAAGPLPEDKQKYGVSCGNCDAGRALGCLRRAGSDRTRGDSLAQAQARAPYGMLIWWDWPEGFRRGAILGGGRFKARPSYRPMRRQKLAVRVNVQHLWDQRAVPHSGTATTSRSPPEAHDHLGTGSAIAHPT